MSSTLWKCSLLLLGKTGSGKSSTGNSILKKNNCFETSRSLKSCTRNATIQRRKVKGVVFKIVDTPGIFDTKVNIAKTLEVIYEGVSLIPKGFNAILLVVNLVNKATEELTQTIKIFKEAFGDSFARQYCIIVFTYGDLFPDLTNDNLKEWCRSEENIEVGSELWTLLRECDFRVVLFDNKNKTTHRESVQKLLDYIDPQAPRYTNELFQKCADCRDARVTSLGFPEQRAKVQEQLSCLEADCDGLLKKFDKIKMRAIKIRARKLKQTLEKASVATDEMNELKLKVDEMIERINNIPENERDRINEIEALKKKIHEMKSAGIAVTAVSIIVIGGLVTALSASFIGVAVAGALGVLTVLGYKFYVHGKKS